MPNKPTAGRRLSPADLTPELRSRSEAIKARAAEARAALAHKPGIEEVLTPEELADAAPFYLELRVFIGQLRAAREAAGLTLDEVARRTGMAQETLSRLETGAAGNPTWQTLGRYAAAVGCRLVLTAKST